IILLFLCLKPLSAQEKLGEYLETAAQNNPKLKAAFNNYMASMQVASQVSSLPDPQVAFAYFIQPVETRNGPQQFVVSASQMFPWFGTLKVKEGSANAKAKASYENFLAEKSKLFSDVRSLYFTLYFLDKSITITRQNIGFLNSIKEMAKIKVEAGTTSTVDQLSIEMMIADMENKLYLLSDDLEEQKLAFANLLNVERGFYIEIPEELWEDNVGYSKSQLLDSALVNNHTINQYNYQLESASHKINVAKKQGSPSFSIGVDYISIGKGDMNMTGNDAVIFPKIGITIPLYRKKYKSMVKEAVYLEASKDNQLQNQNNIVANLIEKGYKNYIDSDRRIELYKRQKELSFTSIKIMETEYMSGTKTFEELLNMESKYLNYSLQLEKARSDKQAAIAFLNSVMGK
ncbi:MAG: TolC family protein, partial [Bacteroidales bacterium]|nr:TolC family protein [Bacteroidales bacterium]